MTVDPKQALDPLMLTDATIAAVELGSGRTLLTLTLSQQGLKWHEFLCKHWYLKDQGQFKGTLASLLSKIYQYSRPADRDFARSVQYDPEWPATITRASDSYTLTIEMTNERARYWLDVYSGTPLEGSAADFMETMKNQDEQ